MREAEALLSSLPDRVGDGRDVGSAAGCHRATAEYVGGHDKRVRPAPAELTVQNLATLARSGRELFGPSDAAGGRIVVFAGGIPLRRDREVVGDIGVSTGTVDQEVAEIGAAAF